MEKTLQEILKKAVGGCADTITNNAPRRTRFAYPIDKDTAARLLSTAYRVEVEARGKELEHRPEISQILWAVAEYLTNPARKPSLLLYGGQPGNGKTTTVRAVVRMAKHLRECFGQNGLTAIMHREKRYINFDPQTIAHFDRAESAVIIPTYYTADDIARLFQSTDPADRQTNRAKFNSLAARPFLAVDDMGKEPVRVSDYGNDFLPLIELISRRYDNQLPTIITCNLSINTISEIYGLRIADRLREMCEMLAYKGPSFRV